MLGNEISQMLENQSDDKKVRFLLLPGMELKEVRIFVNLELNDVGYSDREIYLTGDEKIYQTADMSLGYLKKILRDYKKFSIYFLFTDGYSIYPNVCSYSITDILYDDDFIYLCSKR